MNSSQNPRLHFRISRFLLTFMLGITGLLVLPIGAQQLDRPIIQTFPVGEWPTGLAFDGANIWVVNDVGGSVTKLRASDGAVLGTFSVGTYPGKAAFDGTNIWVINSGDNT